MTGHYAQEDHRFRVHEVIGSQRDIFGTLDVERQCEGVLPVRSTSSGSVGGTATRAWTYRFGTLDVEWQCGRRYPVRSPP